MANQNMFDGMLRKVPEFRVWDAQDCAGHFHVIFGRPVIEINETLWDLNNEYAVLETIVHEMVHQLQWETGRPIRHDSYFYEIFKGVWNEI